MLRCPNCMNEMAQNECTHCGYPDVKQVKVSGALVPGTVVGSRFELGLVKQDSFQSVAYLAWDMQLQKPAVVTEFFPRNQATRKNGVVMPRRFSALFQQACAMYAQGRQPMPLPLIAAFAENGTAYRAYLLEEVNAQTAEVIDRLLDLPVYFRDSSQNPMMNVCALEIPPMPVRREWRQPEHEVIAAKPRQPENNEAPVQPLPQPESPISPVGVRSNHRGLKIAAVAIGAAILATVGATAFFITQKHNVTIEIKTSAGIAAARIGTQQLPAATPDEHGTVAYMVQLANGTYTFEAEGTNGMRVPAEEIQVLSGNAVRQLVLPDPTATPIPRITPEEGEWVYANQDGAYTLVSASGQEEKRGELDCAMYAYTVTLENWDADESASFAVGDAGVEMPVHFSDAQLVFQSSRNSCKLYLSVDGEWKTVADLQAGENRQNKINGEAIRMAKALGESDSIVFVGENNSLSIKELTLGKLDKWVAEYPELYEKYIPEELSLSMDQRMNGASVTIEGMAWEPGVRVCLVGAEQVALSGTVGDASFTETVSVEQATGEATWKIGQEKCDEIAAKWANTFIMLSGDNLILPQNQPALQADMRSFPGVFSELLQEISIKIDRYYLQEEQSEQIEVQIDGQSIAGEIDEDKNWHAVVQATKGKASLTICFKNGYTIDKGIEITGNLIQENLEEELKECEDLVGKTDYAATFRDGKVCLLKDGAIVEDLQGYTAEQVISMAEIFMPNATCQKFEQYDAEITLDERINPDAVSITFAGKPAGELARLSAGEYQVEITVDGRQELQGTFTISAEGENKAVLLQALAEEEIEKLPEWLARPADKDHPLLTEKAIDDEWNRRCESWEYTPITIQLPQEENGVKWLVTDNEGNEGNKLELTPNEQNETELLLPNERRYYVKSQMDGEEPTKRCPSQFVAKYSPNIVWTIKPTETESPTPVPTTTPEATETPTNKQQTLRPTPSPVTTQMPVATETPTNKQTPQDTPSPTPAATVTQKLPPRGSTPTPSPAETEKPVGTPGDLTGTKPTEWLARMTVGKNAKAHREPQTSTTAMHVRNGDE